MRRKFWLILLLIFLGVLIFGVINVSATTINVSKTEDFQSDHPYQSSNSNFDTTWIYTHPTDADALKITFSAETDIAYYDEIIVYDANDNEICNYGRRTLENGTTETCLAGKTLEIEGNVVKIRLTGSYKGYYGFSIDSIVEVNHNLSASIVKSGTCGNNLTYRLDSTGTFLITGTGYMDDYISSYTPWDSQNLKIKRIIIEEGVKSIGAYAFENCTNLESVKFASSVYSIYENAFSGCSKLTNITIPQGVKKIYDNAFKGCTNLVGIILPDGIDKIGRHAFENSFYYKYNKWTYNWLKINKYIIKAVPTITGVSFSFFEPYELIADGAFENCDELTYVSLSSSIRKIGDWAFYGCDKLANVYHSSIQNSSGSINDENSLFGRLNSKLEHIGKHAFAFCPALSRIDIPHGIKTIDDYAFQNSNNISTVYYNGDDEEWNSIEIGSLYNANQSLLAAERKNRYIITFFYRDSRYNYISKVIPSHSIISEDDIPKYTGYTTTYFEDEKYTIPYNFNNPVDKNTVIYMNRQINQYTYKFLDNDGSIIKEETANYNTKIEEPEIPADKDPYTFDYWEGYTSNMKLYENVIFTAKYKYKTYKISIPYKGQEISVVYNDNFTIEPEERNDCIFHGYYTEENGKGIRITDEQGNSLQGYNFLADITAYPYFEHDFVNEIKFIGNRAASIGEKGFSQKVTFATNNKAKYFVCTVKYPIDLILTEIKSDTFEIEQDFSVVDGDTYLYLTCIYDSSIPTNQTIEAFELIFDVSENATANDILTVEILDDAILADDSDNSYLFKNIEKTDIKINPILAKEITIVGDNEIYSPTTYAVFFTPENTSNQEVEWSVSDEAIATISQDGKLTPIKTGNVTITAAAKDGSNVSAEKTVIVKVLATVTNISSNIGIWDREYSPSVNSYYIYVPKNTATITLTAKHDGTLKSPGKTYISNVAKPIQLTNDETVLTLSYICEGYEDNTYTITIKKFEGTKILISDDGKTFTVTPINIETEKIIILALYDGDKFVEMQHAFYKGEDLTFITDKSYTKAKVMVWNDLTSIMPVCESEKIK